MGDWARLARRQAGVYVAGLAAVSDQSLPGRRPTRAHQELPGRIHVVLIRQSVGY